MRGKQTGVTNPGRPSLFRLYLHIQIAYIFYPGCDASDREKAAWE
jgi:hypothetical protein